MMQVWFLFKIIETILGAVATGFHCMGFGGKEPLPHILIFCGTFFGFTLIAATGAVALAVGASPPPLTEFVINFIGAVLYVIASMVSMHFAEIDFHLMYLSDYEEPRHPYFYLCRAQSITALAAGAIHLLHAVLAFDVMLSSKHASDHSDDSDSSSDSDSESQNLERRPIRMYFLSKMVETKLRRFQWFDHLCARRNPALSMFSFGKRKSGKGSTQSSVHGDPQKVMASKSFFVQKKKPPSVKKPGKEPKKVPERSINNIGLDDDSTDEEEKVSDVHYSEYATSLKNEKAAKERVLLKVDEPKDDENKGSTSLSGVSNLNTSPSRGSKESKESKRLTLLPPPDDQRRSSPALQIAPPRRSILRKESDALMTPSGPTPLLEVPQKQDQSEQVAPESEEIGVQMPSYATLTPLQPTQLPIIGGPVSSVPSIKDEKSLPKQASKPELLPQKTSSTNPFEDEVLAPLQPQTSLEKIKSDDTGAETVVEEKSFDKSPSIKSMVSFGDIEITPFSPPQQLSPKTSREGSTGSILKKKESLPKAVTQHSLITLRSLATMVHEPLIQDEPEGEAEAKPEFKDPEEIEKFEDTQEPAKGEEPEKFEETLPPSQFSDVGTSVPSLPDTESVDIEPEIKLNDVGTSVPSLPYTESEYIKPDKPEAAEIKEPEKPKVPERYEDIKEPEETEKFEDAQETEKEEEPERFEEPKEAKAPEKPEEPEKFEDAQETEKEEEPERLEEPKETIPPEKPKESEKFEGIEEPFESKLDDESKEIKQPEKLEHIEEPEEPKHDDESEETKKPEKFDDIEEPEEPKQPEKFTDIVEPKLFGVLEDTKAPEKPEEPEIVEPLEPDVMKSKISIGTSVQSMSYTDDSELMGEGEISLQRMDTGTSVPSLPFTESEVTVANADSLPPLQFNDIGTSVPSFPSTESEDVIETLVTENVNYFPSAQRIDVGTSVPSLPYTPSEDLMEPTKTEQANYFTPTQSTISIFDDFKDENEAEDEDATTPKPSKAKLKKQQEPPPPPPPASS